MKRVRCPKCDNYIQFDETRYEDGQSLVFVCDNCQKQFGIRIGHSKLNAANRKAETTDEREGPNASAAWSSLRTSSPTSRSSPCGRATT